MPTKVNKKRILSLPVGEVLIDSKMKGWVLGTSIGLGGFGAIYLAAPAGKNPYAEDARHVIKIEPFESGPLFCEWTCCQNVLIKRQLISDWMKKKGLDHIGIPVYITTGLHSFRGMDYRFLVMQRYGDDLDKHFRGAERKFCLDTVSYLAVKVALEYLHDSGYVHADIKGSNLLTGFGPEQAHLIYLVDYGLAYRFSPYWFNPDPNGEKHKEYEERPKFTHDGTIEFTSIDAHKGVRPSRRGDLEILGYNLLQWACGELPWEYLNDKAWVAREKIKYRQDVNSLMRDCFGKEKAPSILVAYMTRVYGYHYKEKPDYDGLIKMFSDHLHHCDAVKTLEWVQHVSAPASHKQSAKQEVIPFPKRRKKSKSPVHGQQLPYSCKFLNFVSKPMGSKDVTELAGIGPVLGGRLTDKGYGRSYTVLRQFLALKKNKELFKDWLRETCGANAKQQEDCYNCLDDWCDHHRRHPSSVPPSCKRSAKQEVLPLPKKRKRR